MFKNFYDDETTKIQKNVEEKLFERYLLITFHVLFFVVRIFF